MFFKTLSGMIYSGAKYSDQDVEITHEEHDSYVAETNTKLRIDELKKYLSETDWYVVRKTETGKDIPEEVTAKRQESRDEIGALESIVREQK